MTIKEKPFFESTKNPGPLPGWLFSNPFFAGLFAIFMCGIFVLCFGVVTGFGATYGRAIEVFDGIHMNLITGFGLGAIVLVVILLSIPFARAEAPVRLAFVVGGMLCITLFWLADVQFTDDLREYFGRSRERVL